MDIDYVSKLTDAEKDWLNKFMKEELNASLSPRKDRRKDFNKTLKDRKRVFDNNNARNRCAYNTTDSNNILDYVGDRILENDPQVTKDDLENSLIDIIDRKLTKKLD